MKYNFSMIYLDNAATGGFKPSAVTEAAINAIKYLNANPGRSGHELAVKAQKAVYETRKAAADLFGANLERVVFTLKLHGSDKRRRLRLVRARRPGIDERYRTQFRSSPAVRLRKP